MRIEKYIKMSRIKLLLVFLLLGINIQWTEAKPKPVSFQKFSYRVDSLGIHHFRYTIFSNDSIILQNDQWPSLGKLSPIKNREMAEGLATSIVQKLRKEQRKPLRTKK